MSPIALPFVCWGRPKKRFCSDSPGNSQECRESHSPGKTVEGEIIAGGFGSGKSHLLGYLSEKMLHEKFIVSLVAISKETPLFSVERLYAAAIRNAIVPGVNDDVMTAVVARLSPREQAYGELETWASGPSAGLSPVFAALLYLIPKQATTQEDHAAIGRFLSGGNLSLSKVRQWLRAAGAAKLFDLKPVKADELALQRLRFVPRLFQAAGFSGWCILLDEIELIGHYSTLQRGCVTLQAALHAQISVTLVIAVQLWTRTLEPSSIVPSFGSTSPAISMS